MVIVIVRWVVCDWLNRISDDFNTAVNVVEIIISKRNLA